VWTVSHGRPKFEAYNSISHTSNTKKLYSPWIMRQFVLVPSDQVINV